MNNGRLLAIVITAATVILVVVGTVWPIPSAVAYVELGDASLLHTSSTPEARCKIWRTTSAGLTWRCSVLQPRQQGRIHSERSFSTT